MSHDESQRLVEYLYSLSDRDDKRGELAALRSGLRPGHELDALRLLLRELPRSASPERERRREDDAVLLAGLFALHPEPGSLSLAEALRRVHGETGSDSVEARFRALLDTGRAELPTHLRHAVSLVASKGLGLDWANLHRAIRFWDEGDDRNRRQWAREFWATDEEPGAAADDTNTTTP